VIEARLGRGAWLFVSLASILPLTAVLHHAVFCPYTCILQPLTTTDYSSPVMIRWLRSDPAPTIALVIASGMFIIGRLSERVHLPVVALLVVTAPLTLWIWDVPFTSRVVCRFLHDGRAGVHTRHLYLTAAFAWAPTLVLLRRIRRRVGADVAWLNQETAVGYHRSR